jgi:hypothetical protein
MQSLNADFQKETNNYKDAKNICMATLNLKNLCVEVMKNRSARKLIKSLLHGSVANKYRETCNVALHCIVLVSTACALWAQRWHFRSHLGL